MSETTRESFQHATHHEVADNVIAVVETASTNTLARQMLRDGIMAPPADGGAGVVVVATDVQSAGRGRLERTW